MIRGRFMPSSSVPTNSSVFPIAPVIRARSAQGHENGVPFWGLMFFTFILFIAPQTFWPILGTLRIAMVTAGLALVVYVLDRLSSRRALSVDVPAVRLLFCFVALAGVSIPFSLWPGGSFEAFSGMLLKSLLIFVLVANTVNTVRRMKLMIGSMAVWSILMSRTAIQSFSQGDLAMRGIRIAGYESPLAGNPNDLALILNLVLALLVGLYYATPRGTLKWVVLTAVGLSVAAVVVTFSRAGFLTLLVIVAMVVIKRTRERGPAVLALALVALLVALPVLPQGYVARLSTIVDTQADSTGSATARWDGMVYAWNTILHHPILGVGLKMNTLDIVDQAGNWHWTEVHNVYLAIGADLGLPALTLYLLAMWHLFKGIRGSMRGLREASGAQELLALGTGIRTALVAFCVAAFFHPVAYHFYFFYIAGLAVAFTQITKRAHAQTRGRGEGEGRVLGGRWWARKMRVGPPGVKG